jgi:hypothetical protein
MNGLLQRLRQNAGQVSAIVAIMALFISFLSILLDDPVALSPRQHNYKSLTPIASIPLSDYENKVAIKVKNTGVGRSSLKLFAPLVEVEPRMTWFLSCRNCWTGSRHDCRRTAIDRMEGLGIARLRRW